MKLLVEKNVSCKVTVASQGPKDRAKIAKVELFFFLILSFAHLKGRHFQFFEPPQK